MNRIPLAAEERNILGKKVRSLRKSGVVPAHVFGNKVETEHVSVKMEEFLAVYSQAGSTGVIDLKIGTDRIRPVMVKDIQINPMTQTLQHIDFYQVDLSKKVTVAVPVELIGEDPAVVTSGEAVVIQPLSEIQVEALPTDLIEKVEVDKSVLNAIGDSILVSQLLVPSEITVLTDPESVVVKLDDAVTEEMKKLMEEAQAEAAAAQAEAAPAEGAEGEAKEGEEKAEGEASEGEEGATEEKPAEEKAPEEAAK